VGEYGITWETVILQAGSMFAREKIARAVWRGMSGLKNRMESAQEVATLILSVSCFVLLDPGISRVRSVGVFRMAVRMCRDRNDVRRVRPDR
jgi:hypothetical protein